MRALVTTLVLLAATNADADVVAKPAPFSLGWSLRPAGPVNVVRSDTAIGLFDDGGASGSTVASTFLVAYKVSPELSPLLRFAVIHNDPATGGTATAMSNPLVGAMWAPPIVEAPYKLAFFGGLALPLGEGGGNAANPTMTSTVRSAIAARSSMDNAMFAINDLTPIVGIDAAYVANGLTLQLEATVFELFRVRGEDVQPDAYKTNFTSGAQAAYFVFDWLSAGAELRYQRWLSTPAAVEMAPATRDTVSAAVGVRGHFAVGGPRWLRPGVSYARGLDDPMTGRNYQIVQIDVPFAF
ncbi:MAG TPA: hypothetical protein VFV99_12615 [Kofleriaceae bacterium]|nr:hypothetical protein [Kofleriaceae bacterium]